MESHVLRASSLAELMDCPARWEARHILGLHLPCSPAALLGTAVHAGTAFFDRAVLEGRPAGVDEAAHIVVETLRHPAEEVDWAGERPDTLEPTAIALLHMYCSRIAPFQTWAAVELACQSLDFPEFGITLTGTVDRVHVDGQGRFGVTDIKTGRGAVAPDGVVAVGPHRLQLGAYELLAARTLDRPMTADSRIVGLQTAKTASGRRAGVGVAGRCAPLLTGAGASPGLLRKASDMLRSGLLPGRPESWLCSARFCPVFRTCRWR